MTDPARNAALFAATDGYDTAAKGINGRRVAGQSFFKGFFAHADVSEILSFSNSLGDARSFGALLSASGCKLAHRHVAEHQLDRIGPVGTVYYPAPNWTRLAWRRQTVGQAAYAICGVTHTTSTLGVMQGFFDLRTGPQAPWDAVVCTSRAVHAATRRNLELADAFLRDRMGPGAQLPQWPILPVIPLGLDTAAHARSAADRAKLRRARGWTRDDVVFTTIARLLPYGKFDPGPYFLAMQAAQEVLGTSKRLHVLMCGVYGEGREEREIFENCAARFMPGVGFHHLDGADAGLRAQALSGGDVFAFPIDHVQETFGLAPIEGMAAGLPVLASDWDGIRDTVTPDVGRLIPTRMASPGATRPEAVGHLTGRLNYAQYGANIAAVTELDQRAMREAIVDLARDEALRRRMGRAGLARAQSVFDWSRIIPQYQDLWAEQTARRLAALERGVALAQGLPVSPLPSDLFASYPSHKGGRAGLTAPLVACPSPPDLATIFEVRKIEGLGNPFEKRMTVERIHGQIVAAGEAGILLPDLSRALGWNIDTVERTVLFLLKYGLVAQADPQGAQA